MTLRAPRFPANYAVVMRHGPEMYATTIYNISTGGAGLMGVEMLKMGDVILLDYVVGQTRGKVTWKTGNMAGVKFDFPITDTVVNYIRAETNYSERRTASR